MVPDLKKEAEFSKSNWGDYPEQREIGQKPKVARRATIFKGRIDTLLAAHWDAIVEAATEHMGKKKASKEEGNPVDGSPQTDEETDDEVLFDPGFDIRA